MTAATKARTRQRPADDTKRINWMQRHVGWIDYDPSNSPAKKCWGGSEGRNPVQGRSIRHVIDKLMNGEGT